MVSWGLLHKINCPLYWHNNPIPSAIEICEYLINNSQISGEFIDGKSYYYKLGLLAN
jgi:hypothetical protein